jgi:hypothetical protein
VSEAAAAALAAAAMATTVTTLAAETATAAALATEAAATRAAAAGAALAAGAAACGRRLARQQAFALQLLACELAGPANGFSFFTRSFFGRLFEMAAEFHLAENALALQLFLERLESLVNIVVANENLQAVVSSDEFCDR